MGLAFFYLVLGLGVRRAAMENCSHTISSMHHVSCSGCHQSLMCAGPLRLNHCESWHDVTNHFRLCAVGRIAIFLQDGCRIPAQYRKKKVGFKALLTSSGRTFDTILHITPSHFIWLDLIRTQESVHGPKLWQLDQGETNWQASNDGLLGFGLRSAGPCTFCSATSARRNNQCML